MQYYELLIANDLNKLLKQTSLTKDQLKFAINLLKTLKPYPGMDFDKQESDYQNSRCSGFKKRFTLAGSAKPRCTS